MKTWQRLRSHPELISRYLVRETVIDGVRSFFKSHHFHEVQTPLLVSTPSCEPNLEPFSTTLTTHTGQSLPAYLILSPEFALKKLLAGGLGSCFEITRSFRNHEAVSPQHQPEFTILEWYRVGADYRDIMTDFEQLLLHLVALIKPHSSPQNFTYQGVNLDLSLPWPRLSIATAFSRYAHINPDILTNEPKFIATAHKKGYQVTATTTWEQLFYQIIFNEIEPQIKALNRPVFLHDYPISQASLSRPSAADTRFAERFEVFLAGLELGNCFSELTDASEQARRFQTDQHLRRQSGKSTYPTDQGLLTALKSGLPDVAGIAVGLDRLIMLLADVPSIADTLFFPAQELFDLK